MEIERVLGLLQDSGITVDLATLQNPTEKFMIYVVTEYLKKLSFDGNEIAKVSFGCWVTWKSSVNIFDAWPLKIHNTMLL